MTRLLAASAVLAFPSLAFAHPGHGSTPVSGVAHYVVEPLHAWMLGLLVATALVALAARARAQPGS